MSQLCPCGSGKQARECCDCYLRGRDIPKLPEQLMRSRYSAFVEQDEAYLLQTWHLATRPSHIPFEQTTEWLGLEVHSAEVLSIDEAWVRFSARYRLDGKIHHLHETSRFLRQAGRWFYVDGEHHQPVKAARNKVCPCGSGKKYKRCCGR